MDPNPPGKTIDHHTQTLHEAQGSLAIISGGPGGQLRLTLTQRAQQRRAMADGFIRRHPHMTGDRLRLVNDDVHV